MKISICSDLHLDIAKSELSIFTVPADVLIIAGDLCQCQSLKTTYVKKWFSMIKKMYDKVFYVLGNHEHYDSTFETTAKTIAHSVPKFVTVLDNNFVDYNGHRFIGSTLWTDFNKNSAISKMQISRAMNDYRFIRSSTTSMMITADQIYDEHLASLHFIKNAVETSQNKCIIITHTAPSVMSIFNYHQNDIISHAYYSDLEKFVDKNPNITTWIHGHTHHASDYLIGNTRVICNPYGYETLTYKEHTGFIENLIIDV